MDREGDEVPWDVFFWRNSIVDHFTKGCETRTEYSKPPTSPGRPTPFHFAPDPNDWWQNVLDVRLSQTNSVMYAYSSGNGQIGIRVWGDGVQLFMPYLWLHDVDDQALARAIVNGIDVSRRNRGRLGY